MNQFGTTLRMQIYGESHGAAVGILLDGVPPGLPVDEAYIEDRMQARRPGVHALTTARQEEDRVRILSGTHEGVTTGAPVLLQIENQDARSQDYDALARKPRPGHADYTSWVWSAGHHDIRGGGHSSGRLTAGLVAAAAFLQPVLAHANVAVGAHLHGVGGIEGPAGECTVEEMRAVRELPTAHPLVDQFKQAIEAARKEKDSIGGWVEWRAEGFPAGVGEPFFDSLESRLAHMLFAVPAVKAVSFGDGVGAPAMKGSEHNDPFGIEDGVVTTTNHAGGILGGRSTGMPLWGAVAFKPTSSIFQAQQTVDLAKGVETELSVKGRHDPCIAIRGVPVIQAAVELVLIDFLLGRR